LTLVKSLISFKFLLKCLLNKPNHFFVITLLLHSRYYHIFWFYKKIYKNNIFCSLMCNRNHSIDICF
jgi:hypothetical protein